MIVAALSARRRLVLRGVVLPLLAASMLFAVAGCSDDDDPAANSVAANPAWSSEQADAMSDGAVTVSEYRDGFRRFDACLAAAGFELADVDDSSEVITYGIPDAAVQTGAEATCYEREFDAVDTTWQVGVSNPRIVELLSRCLRSHDLPIPETQDEMAEALIAAGVDPAQCR